MKTYRVETVPAVLKQLKRIPKNDQKKILSAIAAFANDPRPKGFKKLVYYTEFFRFRVGNYRIIYQVFDDVFFSVRGRSDRPPRCLLNRVNLLTIDRNPINN